MTSRIDGDGSNVGYTMTMDTLDIPTYIHFIWNVELQRKLAKM